MNEQTLISPTASPAPPSVKTARPAPILRFVVVATVVAACAAGAWWVHERSLESERAKSSSSTDASASDQNAPRVEVVRPTRGGLGKTVVQPGQVQAFNRAQLYAKVSGYLAHQVVDIGDSVKKGQVLAQVDAPEYARARDEARAAVGQMQSKIKQAEAHVLTTQADREAAAAAIERVQAGVVRYTADRVYHTEALARIKELAQRNAVEQRLVDEEQKQYDAAVSAEAEARAGVTAAKAQLNATIARVVQAQADLEAARSDLEAAKAVEVRSQVFVDYTRIISPYDGVVTLRSFHDGDFVRSAADGGNVPLLAVAQTTLMRVVIYVPDLDVPFVERGEPATLRVDALKEQLFQGKVARFANIENEQKLMRTEIDLPNPDNRLRDGMYGTATILVEAPSQNLRVPSTCVIEQNAQGAGTVYVVRDGKVHRQPVTVSQDNGTDAEIISGLTAESQVVVRYNGTLAEGLRVRADLMKTQPERVQGS